jgi:predicted RNase H-like HicB family nuclease
VEEALENIRDAIEGYLDHGVVADAGLIASAEDAFVTYDKEESEPTRPQAR